MDRLNDIDTLNLSVRIYDVLKNAILQKQFVPGERIDIYQLSEKWNVSRTPIKDAVQRLLAEGLIEVIPRKGTFVAELRIEDIIEMLDVRLMYELYAAELTMATVGNEQLRTLKSILAEADELVNQPELDYIAYTNLDIEFHSEIISWTKNKLFAKTYGAQNFHWHTARIYYEDKRKVREGQQQHWDIYHAYLSGCLDDLKEAINKHILAAKEGVRLMNLSNSV